MKWLNDYKHASFMRVNSKAWFASVFVLPARSRVRLGWWGLLDIIWIGIIYNLIKCRAKRLYVQVFYIQNRWFDIEDNALPRFFEWEQANYTTILFFYRIWILTISFKIAPWNELALTKLQLTVHYQDPKHAIVPYESFTSLRYILTWKSNWFC